MVAGVNAQRLIGRLSALRRELPSAVSAALIASAQTTIDVMQNAARSEWGHDSHQIGFDVEQWNNTISQMELLPGGGFGILNVQRMGTESDYEQIAHVRGAWHHGRRQAKRFETFIAQPGAAEDLAAIRQGIWGSKQPQWFLLNDGNMYPGASDPRPGTHTIERVAFDMDPTVRKIVSDRVNNRLRTAGVLI